MVGYCVLCAHICSKMIGEICEDCTKILHLVKYKKCYTCELLKDSTYFYYNKYNYDKLSKTCVECHDVGVFLDEPKLDEWQKNIISKFKW